MTQLWRTYAGRFDSRTLRERLFVMSASLLLVAYTVYAVAVEPALQRQSLLQLKIAQQETETARLASLPTEMRANDSDRAYQARQTDLAQQIAQLEQTIRAVQKDLVPAQRVTSLLQQMLSREPGLQLVSLRTLPMAPLLVKPPPQASKEKPGAERGAQAGAAEQGVYKHGVEITMRGSYEALHRYLVQLENSPSRMFWWRSQLDTADHPALTMTVTIYTLSLDKAWLQV